MREATGKRSQVKVPAASFVASGQGKDCVGSSQAGEGGREGGQPV